eukprot:5641046-Lingulodinium_polyedra.AAC.1
MDARSELRNPVNGRTKELGPELLQHTARVERHAFAGGALPQCVNNALGFRGADLAIALRNEMADNGLDLPVREIAR